MPSRRTGRVSNGAARRRTWRSRSSPATSRGTFRSRSASGWARSSTTQTNLDIIGRYPGIGSTDFWGISFAPSPLDREPFDAPTFDRQVRLLRAAWAEFDETAARVSAELRPGVRGGGRSRDQIVRHVLANEGGDFSKRVKAKSELEDLLTPDGLAQHRDRFVEAMRAWYKEGKPLGKWTIPYLLRHTAYHVLDHTWEMQDRDLTDDATTR